jgi:uncharacterized pyridoxamine 5'-phosphate oxidase family protein
MLQVYEYLKAAGTYYLATVDGNEARVRPFSKLDVFEDKLYFQTGKVKTISRQLALNQSIEIAVFRDDDTWVRVHATAVEDDRDAARQHMLDTNPDLNDWYKADDGNSQVFYLKDATAIFESFFGEPKVVRF